MGKIGGEPIDGAEVFGICMQYRERLEPRVVDTVPLVRHALDSNKAILLEGQLGVMRDLDWGIYPYVTSSNPTASYAASGAGLPARATALPKPALAAAPRLTNPPAAATQALTPPPSSPAHLQEETLAPLRRAFVPPRFTEDTTVPRSRQTPSAATTRIPSRTTAPTTMPMTSPVRLLRAGAA